VPLGSWEKKTSVSSEGRKTGFLVFRRKRKVRRGRHSCAGGKVLSTTLIRKKPGIFISYPGGVQKEEKKRSCSPSLGEDLTEKRHSKPENYCLFLMGGLFVIGGQGGRQGPSIEGRREQGGKTKSHSKRFSIIFTTTKKKNISRGREQAVRSLMGKSSQRRGKRRIPAIPETFFYGKGGKMPGTAEGKGRKEVGAARNGTENPVGGGQRKFLLPEKKPRRNGGKVGTQALTGDKGIWVNKIRLNARGNLPLKSLFTATGEVLDFGREKTGHISGGGEIFHSFCMVLKITGSSGNTKDDRKKQTSPSEDLRLGGRKSSSSGG